MSKLSENSTQNTGAVSRTTYDFMRVLAMMMVLATHTLGTTSQFMETYNTTWYVNSTLTSFFMICNPIFFMLSGKFNLNKSFNTTKDYLNFYYKKLLTVMVPFVAFSFFFYLYDCSFANWDMVSFIKDFMNGNIVAVYWFMYALVGILVFSPFYSKMLQNMTLLDKRIFFGVLVLTNAFVSIYLLTGNSTRFSYSLFGIITWHLFYFIGYILEDIINTKKLQNIFIALGFVAFVVHFLQKRFLGYAPIVTHDPNPWTIFEAIGFYLIILRIQIKSDKAKKIISTLAGCSFIFYLIHVHILNSVAAYFPLDISTYHNMLYTVIIFVVTFTICAVLSYLINRFLYKPFVKVALKVIHRSC